MSGRNKKAGRNPTRLQAREEEREHRERQIQYERKLRKQLSNMQTQAAANHEETNQNFADLDMANQDRHEEVTDAIGELGATLIKSSKKLSKKLETIADPDGLLKKSEATEKKLLAEKAARKKEAALKKEKDAENRKLKKKLEEQERRAATAEEGAAKAKKDLDASESQVVALAQKLQDNGLSPVAASNTASRPSTFNHTQHDENVDRGITKEVCKKMKAKDLKTNPKPTF